MRQKKSRFAVEIRRTLRVNCV